MPGRVRLKLRHAWRSEYAKPPTGEPPEDPPAPLVNTVPTAITLTKGQPFAIPLTSTGAFGGAYWTVGNIARFKEDDINLLWSDAGEPAAGVYTCVVTVSDELQRSAAVTVTVTLNAAPAQLNGPVQNLVVTAVNETQGLISFDPPIVGDPPTSYLYQVDDSNRVALPADRLMRALSPGNWYDVRVWPVNASGIGTEAVTSFRTPDMPNQMLNGEYIQFKIVDETDQSTYTGPAQAVNAGAAGQEYEMIVETQGGAAHIHKTVSLGGTAGVQVLSTQPGQHMISHWRVPWGAGKATPAVPVVTLRNETDTAAYTALRCIVYLRPLLNRPATIIDAGVVTADPAVVSLSNTPADALVSIAAGAQIAGVDLIADMNNIAPDPIGETFQTALNSAAGHVSPADLEAARTISVDWRDPAGVATPLQPRLTYVVYDKPTIVLPPGNVVPQWSDDVVEGFAVATHFDLGRSDPVSAGHPWTYGRITNGVQLLGELGARKWRSKSYNVTDNAPQMKNYTFDLYSGYGMRGFGPVTNDTDTNSTADRNSIVNRMNGTVNKLNAGGVRRWIAFEGNNESNNPDTKLPDWNGITQAHQRLLYERTMILDNQLDVVAASIWGRNDAARELLGNTADGIDPWCTVGCIHLYNGGRNTNLCGQGLGQDETGSGDMFVWEGIRDAKTLAPTKNRMWGTEMGMQLANEQGSKGWTMPDTWVQALGNNSLDNYGAMTYDLRYMFECYIRGAPYGFNTYTLYVYQDDIQSRPNKCFGLVYPNQAKTLNIPRPRYYSFKRLLNLFKDRGSWSGTAWQFNAAPTLTPITPRVTGGNALTFPIVPGQTQRGKWYKKRNGQLLGIFWQNEVMFKRSSTANPVNFHRPFENPTYDPTTVKTPDNTLTPARRTITVEPNVGQTFSKIEVFEPTFDNNRPAYGQDGLYGSDGTATAAKTVNNASSISVQVGGHLVVVVATP